MAYFDTTWYLNWGNGSSTGYYAVPVWPGALSAVTAGTWCRQLTAPSAGNERCFVCVTAGTTGASEPVWVVTRGADSAANIDGTVKWMECTGMAGPCGDLTNAPTWTTVKNAVVNLGEVIYDSGSASLQAATTAGTAGNGATPSFSATAGVTTADNTITWTSLGPVSNYTTAFKYPHARFNAALASGWAAAGNTVYVSNNHAETFNSAYTINNFGLQDFPIQIICVNDSTAPPTALATTASLSTTGASTIQVSSNTGGTLNTVAIFYGINFNAGSSSSTANINLGTAIQSGGIQPLVFDTCSFKLNNTSTSSRIQIGATAANVTVNSTYFTNCSFVFGNTSQALNLGGMVNQIIGGSIALTGTAPTLLFAFYPQMGYNLIRDVDISGITGTLLSFPQINSLIIENCKLANGVAIASGAGALWNGGFVRVHNCDSTGTNYRYYYQSSVGTIQQETTIVRSGSNATNGTTPISWSVTTSSHSQYYYPFISEEITQWNENTGSALSLTMYLTSNSSLTNKDCWVEVEFLGSSGSPLATTTTTRMAFLTGTPVTLTTDSSTWGGAITNKYKITASFTPQMKGPVKLRIYAAKASTTIYVDPFIYLTDTKGNLKSSGRSFLIPGGSYANETAPSLMQLPFTGGIHG